MGQRTTSIEELRKLLEQEWNSAVVQQLASEPFNYSLPRLIEQAIVCWWLDGIPPVTPGQREIARQQQFMREHCRYDFTR